jgi:murein DD-endopeptidase MepM/ murein hydrolase activator NlpD
MLARRYTVLIADRSTGLMRRVTISLRSATFAVVGVLMLPVLIGLGAKWSALAEIRQLRTAKSALEIETSNYRVVTGELASQIQSLETVIDDLGARASLDPEQARAMQRLPAVVKARATGGGGGSTLPGSTASKVLSSSLTSPEDTFGVLRTLLQVLERRLSSVRVDVERQEALAAATPSIWPTYGWLSGTFGRRRDPFTGEPAFHQGLDISAEKGQPVYATANGVVQQAAYTGEYGNLIVLKHDFGLSTRYGHLSRFNVKAGALVKRGDIVGFVGSTGRSTGAHLHYEILANGKLLNPLQLLTQPSWR